jgi:hypothetical protein
MNDEQRRLMIAQGWQVFGQDVTWILPVEDYEYNSDHPRPPGQPATPAGNEGLSTWSGERMGVPNRNHQAEIDAIDAQLAALAQQSAAERAARMREVELATAKAAAEWKEYCRTHKNECTPSRNCLLGGW